MNNEFSKRGIKLARRVRKQLSTLFRLPDSDRIIFTPSLLVAIQFILLRLNKAERIALGSSEYYTPEHFPGLEVKTFEPSRIVDAALEFRPQIVILSLVSWRGNLIPLSKLFKEARLALGENCPIFVADCTHAGAAGFPRIDEIDADIVCGDASKWIMPQTAQRNLAFMWFPKSELYSQVSKYFKPFYLATEGAQLPRASRWIEPEVLQALTDYLASTKCSRRALRHQHAENMKLAAGLTDGSADTSIVLIKNPSKLRALPKFINELGLTWELPDGVRILCRVQD